MLHSRTLNNKINRIHERALRTVYSDYNSSFNELLDKDGSFKIHQRTLKNVATKKSFSVASDIASIYYNEAYICTGD